MYLYETHLHTYPVSRCARKSVEENLLFYKEQGYDGIFITNHFLDGNINIDRSLPYCEKIAFYFSDYEKALELAPQVGIRVFCGVELSYFGTDFLVYGLDKKWFLEHESIMTMERSQQLSFFRENGALVIQAHPFRQARYIDHIRLFPAQVHGVEVFNAGRSPEDNEMARLYAQHYGLIPFAGTDNHLASEQKLLGGMATPVPIAHEADFVRQVLSRTATPFTRQL